MKAAPGAQTAFFSILGLGTHIAALCGSWKGVIRCYVGLIVPEPNGQRRIRVADTIAHWEEGKRPRFSTTSTTRSLERHRWCARCSLRGCPSATPLVWSAVNRFIINAIAASPFIGDAKKNHEAGEKRMAQLWR